MQLQMTTPMTMMAATVLIMSATTAASAGSSDGPDKLSFRTVADGFEVVFNNKTIFSHTSDKPMLFGGQGDTEFIESKGNFRILDYVTSRFPLQKFNVSSGSDNHWPLELMLYASDEQYVVTVTLRLSDDPKESLVVDVLDMKGCDRLWLRVPATRKERVYGGGEQFSSLNLRGRAYPIWTREQGVGRNKSTLTTFYADQQDGAGGDYHTTYFPQLTFVSSRNYYLHHAGPNYAVLDFSREDFHEIFVLGKPGRIYVTTGSDTKELISHMTAFLGRQPPLPDWIHAGAILGVQGGTEMMLNYLRQAKEHGVVVAGVWIQDWVGRITTSFGRRLFWDWRWNSQQYPGLKEEIERLKVRGIRVLAYINPYLNSKGELFKVADNKGYLVKNASNQTFVNDFGEFYCGTLDLTNPEAVTWYKDEVIKKNLIDLGFSGWMADFGEYLPVNGVAFHSGQSSLELHNQWPVLWAGLNREAVREAGREGDIVFWMRAGFSGSSKYSTLMWAGDQNVDWSLSDGLASTITAALSLALSGVTLTHFDIGGFTTFAAFAPPLVRTEELLLRSAEMAVFSPVFRTHEGNQPTSNVQFYSSEGTLKKFARLSRMFAALSNYTSQVVRASFTSGLPAQRPLLLNYPDDDRARDAAYQYMLGDDLLVAPVYLPGVESWEVYLPFDPQAVWVFLWNETLHSAGGRGETVRVPAPLGRPPVFFRSTSAFVDVFRRAASEPLVPLPEFVPENQKLRSSPNSVTCSAGQLVVDVLVVVCTILVLLTRQ